MALTYTYIYIYTYTHIIYIYICRLYIYMHYIPGYRQVETPCTLDPARGLETFTLSKAQVAAGLLYIRQGESTIPGAPYPRTLDPTVGDVRVYVYYIHIPIDLQVYMYICIYTCLYIFVFTYTVSICIYVYIHIRGRDCHLIAGTRCFGGQG